MIKNKKKLGRPNKYNKEIVLGEYVKKSAELTLELRRPPFQAEIAKALGIKLSTLRCFIYDKKVNKKNEGTKNR